MAVVSVGHRFDCCFAGLVTGFLLPVSVGFMELLLCVFQGRMHMAVLLQFFS